MEAFTTTSNAQESSISIESAMKEAMALIKFLAPNEVPENCNFIRGLSGLRIVKNDFLPENTVIVSKGLFRLIYESSEHSKKSAPE